MFGLREEIEFVPVCLRPGQTKSQKEIQRRVHTGCEEKRATRAKFVVFYLLIRLVSFDVLVAVAVAVAADAAVARSSLLPGFIDVRKRLGIRTRFWQKRLPSFHQMYMSFKIRSIRELLLFSGNRHLGREEKNRRCLRKNIYFKETSRVE